MWEVGTYQDGMSKPDSQRKACGKEEIQQTQQRKNSLHILG